MGFPVAISRFNTSSWFKFSIFMASERNELPWALTKILDPLASSGIMRSSKQGRVR